MKQMWDKKELIKLIEEHGGQITPEKLLDLLNEGDNITIELVETKEGKRVRISASGGGGSSDWDEITNKPFEDINKDDFDVDENGILSTRIAPQKLLDIIQGSETIVVDLSEDEEHIEIHLDGDVVSKLDRALLTPLTLTEFKLVGVDVANKSKTTKKKGVKSSNAPEQRMIGLNPDTMEIDNEGRLNVKSGSSEIHLYEHNIEITSSNFRILLEIITNNNQSINTIDKIFSNVNSYKIVNGIKKDEETFYHITNLSKGSSSLQYQYTNNEGSLITENITSAEVLDNIKQII